MGEEVGDYQGAYKVRRCRDRLNRRQTSPTAETKQRTRRRDAKRVFPVDWGRSLVA